MAAFHGQAGTRRTSVEPPSRPPRLVSDRILGMQRRMCAAIESEVEGARQQDRQRAVSITSGRPIRDDQGRRLMEFVRPRGRRIPSVGEQATLEVGSGRYEAAVVAKDQSVVRIHAPEVPAADVPAGLLMPDTAWIPQRLPATHVNLAATRAGSLLDQPFNLPMGLLVLGQGAYRTGCGTIPGKVLQAEPRLHEAQLGAVRLSLGSNALYVWGPPGTGKTLTLARIVEAHLRKGRSVLAVCATNQAVDLLTTEVGYRLRVLRSFRRGLLVRHGPGVTRSLAHDLRPFVLPDEIATRLAAEAAPRRPGVAPLRADSIPTASRLVHDCRMLATTVHQTYLTPAISRLFDVVVIDEASMMQIPQVYLAAGLARRAVIVAGDFMQLPPVSVAPDPHWRRRLERDVFRAVGIPDDLERDDEIPYLAMLPDQHRMADDICHFVGSMFYGERLRSAPAVLRRPPAQSVLGRASLVALDTSSLGPVSFSTADGSRWNPVHAAVIQHLMDYLLLDREGKTDPTRGPVAVLTPFTAQARAIKNRVRRRHAARCVPVLTVHRAQGDEFRTVIVDLTDAYNQPTSRFMRLEPRRRGRWRLLNVAASRAVEPARRRGMLRLPSALRGESGSSAACLPPRMRAPRSPREHPHPAGSRRHRQKSSERTRDRSARPARVSTALVRRGSLGPASDSEQLGPGYRTPTTEADDCFGPSRERRVRCVSRRPGRHIRSWAITVAWRGGDERQQRESWTTA